MQLTKAQLLSAGPKRKTITIADLGDVTIRQLTAKETLAYIALQKADKHDQVIHHVLIAGVADPELTAADADAIMAMGGLVVGDIMDEVLTLSKLKKSEDDDEKKAVAANSGKTTTADSSTASA